MRWVKYFIISGCREDSPSVISRVTVRTQHNNSNISLNIIGFPFTTNFTNLHSNQMQSFSLFIQI